MPRNKKDLANIVTHQRLLEFLSYDPATGTFAWRDRQTNKPFVGSIARNGRLYIRIDGMLYLGHRLAWYYVYKEWPVHNIIVCDGDYLNLRIANLKMETQAETTQRMSQRKSGTGIRGVIRDKRDGRYIVMFRKKYIGRYDTPEEASAVYEKLRIAAFGASSAQVMAAVDVRKKAQDLGRYRALWKRVLRNAGGVTGWANLDDFIVDLDRVEWINNREIVPIEQVTPIGPGNWKWEDTLHGKFDVSTREGRAAYTRAYRAAYPMVHRDRFFHKEYGIPLAEYLKMLAEQEGVCGCCGKQETEMRNGKVRWLAVDHCHSGGEVRGLLCGACNRGVGLFKDDPAALRAMADYLDRHLAKRAAGAVSNVIPLKKPNT